MTYPRTTRSCDEFGPQRQNHAIPEIEIQKIQTARVAHRHPHRCKIGISLKLTDDAPQTRHILRFHSMAWGTRSGAVYLNFGLHILQSALTSYKLFPGLSYMLAPHLLVCGFSVALPDHGLFRLSITTAHALPHHQAQNGRNGNPEHIDFHIQTQLSFILKTLLHVRYTTINEERTDNTANGSRSSHRKA